MLEITGLGYFVLALILGLAGRKRECGFGWPFLLSIFFTPIIGFVLVLLSNPLPLGDTKWGCFWPTIILFVISLIAIPLLILFGAAFITVITGFIESSTNLYNI